MHNDYLLKGRQRSVMLVLLLFMAVATFAVPASSDAEVLLYEGLSKYTEGGDGTQAIGTSNQYLDYKKWSELTKIFFGKASNAYTNGGCLKFGTNEATGSMKTGDISLVGSGVLTFYLKKYGTDSGKLNVTVIGATADVTQFTPSDGWELCTVNLTNVTGPVTITLATSSKRAYVDEITLVGESGGVDPIDPTVAYYQNADGKTGEALKTAMSGIIYNRTEKSYDYLWTAFLTTDVRSDGMIWDMYSNITNYTPVTSGSTYSKEGDCYNREHSFPQSWFGSTSPMYTDLHHIYPTDGYVNGMRSNNPFGETNGEDYTSANNFSKLGKCTYPGYTGKVFEPADEYKGDFARTYFYVVTCYEEQLPSWYSNNSDSHATLDGSTYPGLQTWQLNMLMQWAKDDPVSEKETNRNNAVYAIQNNRNPFIDYPGLEEYVWGSMTTTAFSYDNYVQPVYKQSVTMAFSPAEATAILGEDFTAPTLTTTPANLTVNYSSSEPSVATVDSSTGEVTLEAAGTTVITATFAGNDDYDGASASYTLTVSEQPSSGVEVVLYEGLSKSTAVSDGTNEIATNNQNLDYNNWSKLTKIFVGNVTNAYSNGGCLKLGTADYPGSMKTDDISLTGSGTLTFYLKKYGSDTGKLKVTVTGATANVTEFTPQSSWTPCTVNLTNASGAVTIQLATTTKRAYVDEIMLTAPYQQLALVNNGDNNTATISTAAASGKKCNVTLADRILYKDGEWNTICLPFDVTLANSPLAGATAKTLDDATMTGTTVSLTFGSEVSRLEAGVPYIIKWEGDGTDNIENPVFNGVTVVNRSDAERTIEKAGGKVKFIGYYDAFTINTPANDDIYYMTAGNTLKHTGKERTLKACRAYFQFSAAAAPHQIVLNFNDVVTGIATADFADKTDAWYDLNGRRLYQKPTMKGLYIHGGKKVVVK